MFNFFPASGTLRVFKKLQHTAAFIFTEDHQRLPAMPASLVDKGLLGAMWTGNIQWSATTRAKHLVFFYWTQTRRTKIAERTAAAAGRTKTRVTFNQRSTMDAWLFVKSHR
jgi:hypothetical protein